MLMTTFEYKALLRRIENENKIEKNKTDSSSSSFYTWKEPGIVYDEWGNSHLGVVEKTGFEGDGA